MSAPTATLMDGSAVFFAARSLHPTSRLQYEALTRLLVPADESAPMAAMWTTYDVRNEGQKKYLKFMEKLGWEVIGADPRDAPLTTNLDSLGLPPTARLPNRLVRFDASLAFAAARLAERRITIVSDSFWLAEPLVRAARIRDSRGSSSDHAPNRVCFFGRLLDERWERLLPQVSDFVELVDLDEYVEDLFGLDTRKGGFIADSFLLD